jgi:hypothetical protein
MKIYPLIKHYAMKMYREVKVKLEVIGQFHIITVSSPVPNWIRSSWSQGRSGHGGEEEKSLPSLEI